MPRDRRPAPPLDAAALDRLALRYVERFATSRGKLADYLARKVRERGWAGERAADPAALAERMAELGYVDDRAFAEARARGLARRGLGAGRVRMALRDARIGAEDAAAALGDDDPDAALATALAFARRRRIGPFALAAADPAARKRAAAALIRAGHAPGLAWRIAAAGPGDDVDEA